MQVRRMGGVQAGNDQQSRTPETPEPSRTQLFLYAATAEPKQNPTSMREERGRTGDGAAPQGGSEPAAAGPADPPAAEYSTTVTWGGGQ